MARLYWFCTMEDIDWLLGLLAAHGQRAQLVGKEDRIPILTISDPGPTMVRLTAELLCDACIASAALTAKPLLPNELYLAAEWRCRIVVEEAEIARMVAADGLLFIAEEYQARELIILGPHPSTPRVVASEAPGQRGEPIQSVLVRHASRPRRRRQQDR